MEYPRDGREPRSLRCFLPREVLLEVLPLMEGRFLEDEVETELHVSSMERCDCMWC